MKNENDVRALKALIAKLSAKGASLPENLTSRTYGWNEEGRLTELCLACSGIKGHLSLEGFPALERLNVAHNSITSLDVSACPKLEYLNCFDNKLDALDVTHNPELKILRCRRNRITALNVSACPVLENLSCASRHLISLCLSKNTAFMPDRNALRGVRLEYPDGTDASMDDCISRSGVLQLIDELGYVNCHDGRDYAANSRMDKIRQRIVEMPSFDMGMEEEKEDDYEK